MELVPAATAAAAKRACFSFTLLAVRQFVIFAWKISEASQATVSITVKVLASAKLWMKEDFTESFPLARERK